MTNELKPCPFCGSKAELHMQNSTDPNSFWFIRCSNDECLIDTELDGRDVIIKCWNTRHTTRDLSSIDNISLMAESVRRGLATVEPDTLPAGVIESINIMIDTCNIKNEEYELGYLAALDDVLSLRKPEDKE